MNDLPEYPEFIWDEFFWITSAKLHSWQSLASQDKCFKIVFAPEGRNDSPLIEKERMLVEWIIDHEEEIYPIFMEMIYDSYPRLQKEYSEYFEPNKMSHILPDLTCIEELSKLISIHSINVHPLEKEMFPFFGIEFSCPWDAENGLGILMNGTEIMEMGDKETAVSLRKLEEYITFS